MLKPQEALPLNRATIEDNSIPVTESGCWIWLKSTTGTGYGEIQRKLYGGKLRAHRASYELYKGPIRSGLHVLHSCDERLCVNPDHLSVGTNVENILDSMKKGRRKRTTWTHRPAGMKYKPQSEETKDGQRKIKNHQMPEIMQLRRSGLTLRQIGEKFNVNNVTIYYALKRFEEGLKND